MNQVVVAPDKFKGSLSAPEVAAHVAAGLRRARPDVDVREVPVADGGDGTLDATLAAGFTRVPVTASGPTGEPVTTAYVRQGDTAVVELADVSGLSRLPGRRLAPLIATSFGTGEVIRAALDDGCRTIVLGLGGSACTDGGAGMAQALGVRLLDEHGDDLPPGGEALTRLATVDVSGVHPAVGEADIVVASDVDNPLLGKHGAAGVYGPQKGADAEQVELLDAALARWAEVLERDAGVAPATATLPGAGAAGGVGFAALALLDAKLRPGIEYLLDLVGFHRQLTGASLVVTGEGSLDEQTLRGKAPAGVADAARAAGVPVVAVAGRCLLPHAALHAAGFAGAYALTDIEPDQRRCVDEAGPLLERLAEQRLAAIIDTDTHLEETR
ncbi:glycerate kinase [Haloechinothrix salitolerans]|uniref:Glycerate kinase n=1 Tax=Haloechinothrix salitolerans TaxID=926830 RepID=A0ABW2C6A7_9PSEU